MTPKKIEELINLYIDNEISSKQLRELCHQIQKNPQYKNLFIQYCRLNQITSKAVNQLPPDLFSNLKDTRKRNFLPLYLEKRLSFLSANIRSLAFYTIPITAILVAVISSVIFFDNSNEERLVFSPEPEAKASSQIIKVSSDIPFTDFHSHSNLTFFWQHDLKKPDTPINKWKDASFILINSNNKSSNINREWYDYSTTEKKYYFHDNSPVSIEEVPAEWPDFIDRSRDFE